MISPPADTRIWIAAGVTNMSQGFNRLAALVQTHLEADPFSGQIFAFRGRRGDHIKLLWGDDDGLCLYCKRLEQGGFVGPQATSDSMSLTAAQLSILLEDIDWRRTNRTAPVLAVGLAALNNPGNIQAGLPRPNSCRTIFRPGGSSRCQHAEIERLKMMITKLRRTQFGHSSEQLEVSLSRGLNA